LTGYLRSLKVEKNLSPTSIKHRIQALSRAIDEYLRHNLDVKIGNPVKLLPKGYSTYSDVDAQMVKAKGGKVKVNEARDRRLLPGEHEKIVAVLSGYERPDRARGLELKGGDVTLSQVPVPFGNRTTGMMKARIGPGACHEEEQVH
jgi:hypothetical protein